MIVRALKSKIHRATVTDADINYIGSISIDRNKITRENLGFSEKIKSVANSTNRPIIIFPQATRVSADDRAPFKKGVARIYEDLKIKCQPLAINSGLVWPKTGKLISNKTITVYILKEINPGMNEKDFTDTLQKNIYNELDLIS